MDRLHWGVCVFRKFLIENVWLYFRSSLTTGRINRPTRSRNVRLNVSVLIIVFCSILAYPVSGRNLRVKGSNLFLNITIILHLHEIVCVCVCLSVCVSNSACEQTSSRTDASILTRFSLNGCFAHWLVPYWNWWPWIKGQGRLYAGCP